MLFEKFFYIKSTEIENIFSAIKKYYGNCEFDKNEYCTESGISTTEYKSVIDDVYFNCFYGDEDEKVETLFNEFKKIMLERTELITDITLNNYKQAAGICDDNFIKIAYWDNIIVMLHGGNMTRVKKFAKNIKIEK